MTSTGRAGSTVSTHVLDTATGRPAAGVDVVLERREADRWVLLGRGGTDADGRCRDLTDAPLPACTARLTFATGAWFASSGVEAYHPEVSVTFRLDGTGHHHVPLLVAPFGFTTYRGS